MKANALAHRCWDVGANVKISMLASRIEILSPGGLPDGITEDEYVAGGPSIARNPILANVLFRLGFIERFGTGIPRIIDEYTDMTVSPEFIVRDSSITVSLPAESNVSLTPDEGRVLGSLQKGLTLTRAEIADSTRMSKDKTIRILNNLLEKRLVAKVGTGRSVRYSRR